MVLLVDHEELRGGVREVCARYSNGYWRELDAERRYPEEFVGALGEAGYLLAALIPEEYGGWASTSRWPAPSWRGSTAAVPTPVPPTPRCTRWRHSCGTAPIASSELRLQAFAVTEPEAGTDTASIRTAATREGAHCVVNGSKIYISRVQQSDLMVLLARTTPLGEVEKRTKGLSSHFVWLNRSKESLALDLKQEGAREVLERLLERADVFVQNLAPGAAGRPGFGAESPSRTR